jgi:hypothetical protein
MDESELDKKRKDFRDKEVQNKIAEYSTPQAKADHYHEQTIKTHYTKRTVDRRLSKFAWFLVISQATSIIYFSSLYVFTYIPKTKAFVVKVLP